MRKTYMLSALVLPLVLGACSDDPAGPAGSQLSDLEQQLSVLSLFDRAVAQPVSSPLPPNDPEAGPAGAPQQFMAVVEGQSECSGEGIVEHLTDIEGTVDDETGALDLSFLVELDHEGCVEDFSEQGIQIEFNGNPGLVALFEVDRNDQGEISVAGALNGTVNVTTETVTVACIVSMEFTGTGDLDAGVDYGLAGSFCGALFQATFSTGL